MAPPAPPPPSAASLEPIKPGRRWYWIGGLLIAAGIAAAVALFAVWAVKTSNTVDDFARVRVPPEGTTTGLIFKKAGTYTIYYEWRSEVTDENGSTQRVDNSSHKPPSQLDIVITGPDGKTIPTQAEDEDITFSFNDKIGRAVKKVDIPAPGAYTMKVTSNATEPFAIAVGKGIIHTIVPYALIGIGAFLLGLILGLVAIIVTAVTRGRRKRERRAAELGGAGGYPAPAAAAASAGAYAPPPTAWSPPPAAASPPAWDAPPTSGRGPDPAPAPETPPTTPMPAPAPPAGPESTPPWGPPGG